jgi:Uncharacterized protein conserved in bacteria (DUF2272)
VRDARGVSVGSFGWSARERREADLFLVDLLGYATRPRYGEQEAQVCGFFRPDKTARTMAQLRAAIVARCNAEWTAWHTGTTPKPECDVTMFGRLIGYYLAANRNILPDSLTRIQANALGTINYTPLLAATSATPAQIAAIRTLLLAGAPGTTAKAIIDEAMSQARQGHDSLGSFRAWSAVFVSACVRGAAISEGIEAVTTPGRKPFGLDRPLRPSFSHAAYVRRARKDRAAGRLGRYHAFVPSARAPQLADIIVQDRRDNIGPSQVRTLPTLPKGAETHGDIVVEVSADSVVTIGGNVADGVRKRRFPRDTNTTSGLLVTTVPQLYGQEDDAGGLPAAPGTSCQALADKSTKRIFALLSLVEDCRDIPSNGGSGSGSGSGSGGARADRQ